MTSADHSVTVYRPEFPYHMVWLSTDACTARCLHCSSNSDKRSPDELDTTEVCDLFDQFAEAGVVDLAISGGEPLLRKDLFDIIVHARSLGMTLGVGSNGAKLKPETAARLYDSGVNRLQLSLDGFPGAHEELRCWPGLFDRVLRSIDTALSAGLRTHVCCTLNRLNIEALDDFVEFVASLGIHRLNISRYVPTGRGHDALDLEDGEWRASIETCDRLREEYADRMEITTHLAQEVLVREDLLDMPGFVGCQAGMGQGCVTANGTVLPCVLLPVPLGNVRENRFRDIWAHSPILKQLRDRSSLDGVCGNCSINAKCGGCRAVAYAKTGDYLASDPRCWHVPAFDDAVTMESKETYHEARS